MIILAYYNIENPIENQMIFYIWTWILFFVVLIFVQVLYYSILKKEREGMDNTCPPQPSDLDKLKKRMDDIQANVFDLSLNMTGLQKNVTTLMKQQTSLTSSLKTSSEVLNNMDDSSRADDVAAIADKNQSILTQ